MQTSLPIWQIQAEIVGQLRADNRLVLVAPTGSGKTTQVPQMLMEAGLAGDKKVVVLQPRRVAARTVAARVAWERQCHLGAEVGYQIRFEDQTSLGTRLCYVTEGILLRWLQDRPTLSDVGIVLFDEFHERNLLSDVSLALVKQIQESTRPDLKLAVMSATLDAAPVAQFLAAGPEGPPCPILVSEGRSFAVEVQYLDRKDDRPMPDQAADAVERILHAQECGDVLVFMPGMAEINATLSALRGIDARERLACIPLHGELPAEEQDRAFAPNPLRKVIVSTNVAETSVTIDGVRHVVDSGLARVARYDGERGMSTLFLEETSRASAEQRKGRAGRTAPGTCYRLWTESGHLNRPERNTPEIQRSDLAEVVLLLHSLGIRDAARFDWLDKPEPLALARAEKLLQILGAIDPMAKTLTAVGRQMLRLPMHPRYSRMLVEAAQWSCVPEAALCAALVSGRDLLLRLGRDEKHIAEARDAFEASEDSDFFRLMQAFQFAREQDFAIESCRRYGIHGQTARQVEQTYEQILQIARAQDLLRDEPRVPAASGAPAAVGRSGVPANEALCRCLLAGFVDQLCVRRDRGTLECTLTECRQGTLVRESVVQHSSLFVAAGIREVDSRSGPKLTLLSLATAIKREWIEEMFPQHLSAEVVHVYDRTQKRVAAVKVLRFLDLILQQDHQRLVDPQAAGRALAQAYVQGCFELPLFHHEIKQFIGRVNLLQSARPELEFPKFDQERMGGCLCRAFAGLTLAKEAQAVPLRDWFRRELPNGQLEWLEELAPVHIAWPDGRKMKLLYSEQARDVRGQLCPPEVQVKLHECFALREHPRIAEGTLPVKLWLCAPDGKRLAPTLDWPHFRLQEYPKLKPTLQKRYLGIGWI